MRRIDTGSGIVHSSFFPFSITSFGERSNDYETVVQYFRAHFLQVHRRNNENRRVLYTHFTSVVVRLKFETSAVILSDMIVGHKSDPAYYWKRLVQVLFYFWHNRFLINTWQCAIPSSGDTYSLLHWYKRLPEDLLLSTMARRRLLSLFSFLSSPMFNYNHCSMVSFSWDALYLTPIFLLFLSFLFSAHVHVRSLHAISWTPLMPHLSPYCTN